MSLRPSILVALRTTITGGVEYRRVDLDAEGVPVAALDVGDSAKTEVTRWETTRVVADADAYERAKKVRGKARSLIAGTCSASDFGLMCPEAREDALDAAYAEAIARVNAHNVQGGATRVNVYMVKGRVAASDEMAAKAIGAEVRELLDAMKGALANADVGAIREAANKARALGRILDEETAGKLGKAIDEARSAAKAIVKRVEVGGEDAALVIQELSRKAIDEARFCFLDLEPVAEVEASAVPSRALDLEPSGEVEASAPEARSLDVEAVDAMAAEGV
jgi:hypothetical protein